MAAPLTFPAAVCEGSGFFMFLVHLLFFSCLFHGIHEKVPPCGFGLHFPEASDVEHLFMCLLVATGISL